MRKIAKIVVVTGDQSKLYELRKGMGLQALPQDDSNPIEFDCRKADCGICIVTVVEGAANFSEKTKAEADFLNAMHADPDERLACQCRVFDDVTIKVDVF